MNLDSVVGGRVIDVVSTVFAMPLFRRRTAPADVERTPELASRSRGTRLFLVYAVASLVPVSLLGVMLMRGYHDTGVSHALDQGRAQAAVIEQMAVAPALGGADLARGLSPGEKDRLRSATDLAIFHGSVVRLRLVGFNGSVVFTDNGLSQGVLSVKDPAFRAAAAGEVHAEVVDQGPMFAAPAIRVLQPVVPEATGRAVGVLEVFLPYDQIAADVQADTREAIVKLAIGLVILYAVLALISFWTTRALRRFAARNEHQALHDSLTGLPNRELFRRVTESALARCATGERGALVLVDLDHFKEVNDTLGHHAGDELLRVVGERLTAALRTDDTVARLGGDEFGILLPGGDRDETVALLERVRRQLGEPVTIEYTELTIDASFGVCFYPDDAHTVEELLQHADAAMYHGKHGTFGVVVYEKAVSRPALDALVMHTELRRALEQDELVLHYQPKIDLASGRITTVEALVRWQHPERGLLLPGEFLAVAERGELIEPLTRWVLRRALADCVAWRARGDDWDVAVNVSARNLGTVAFAEEVRAMLDEAGLPASRLCLEVTETALAADHDVARHVVEALADHGIAMALDDFGVGFTGIAQLRDLALAEIKVDRLFITGLAHSQEDRAITGALIDLSHSLGCTVTAEGVESAEVAAWLRTAGCDSAQGFLFARPTAWTDLATDTVVTGSLLDLGVSR